MIPTTPPALVRNQIRPFCPTVISVGPNSLSTGTGHSSIWPFGVIRPTFAPFSSVNQRLPSLPATIFSRPASGVGTG